PVGHIPQGATLTVNTSSSVSIKSEPVSPNRDRSTPCSSSGGTLTSMTQYHGALRPEPTGRSPVDSLSSNGSSYEGSDRDDGAQPRAPDFGSTMPLLRPAGEGEQEGASVKRMRLDAWLGNTLLKDIFLATGCLKLLGQGLSLQKLILLFEELYPAQVHLQALVEVRHLVLLSSQVAAALPDSGYFHALAKTDIQLRNSNATNQEIQTLNKNLTAEKENLEREIRELKIQGDEYRMERDSLNQTLMTILQFDNFPVTSYCEVSNSRTKGSGLLNHLRITLLKNIN
ncbi:hypothetical protein Z043_122526, partial [Scleropages formosus]